LHNSTGALHVASSPFVARSLETRRRIPPLQAIPPWGSANFRSPSVACRLQPALARHWPRKMDWQAAALLLLQPQAAALLLRPANKPRELRCKEEVPQGDSSGSACSPHRKSRSKGRTDRLRRTQSRSQTHGARSSPILRLGHPELRQVRLGFKNELLHDPRLDPRDWPAFQPHEDRCGATHACFADLRLDRASVGR
jgi:hypothetical protein